jgi:hypothetical protein
MEVVGLSGQELKGPARSGSGEREHKVGEAGGAFNGGAGQQQGKELVEASTSTRPALLSR